MRSVHVYPKAQLVGGEWDLHILITDQDTGERIEPVHVVAAGVAGEGSLMLLKVNWDMEIPDDAELVDVDEALFSDDIRPAPGQTETVWGNWQDTAEGIIAGLPAGYTADEFQEAWSKGDTAKVRQDANRALVIQRGWSIIPGTVHQHEGDGTNTDG